MLYNFRVYYNRNDRLSSESCWYRCTKIFYPGIFYYIVDNTYDLTDLNNATIVL